VVRLIILLIIVAVYFIPSMIAYSRNKKDRFAILALNIFLGWTIAGWIGAFIWSLWEEKKKTRTHKVEPLDIGSEKGEIEGLEEEIDNHP